MSGGAGGGEANTASNVGVGNVQLFRAKSGADLQFRSLQFDPARFSATLSGDGLSYTLGVQPVTINDASGFALPFGVDADILRGLAMPLSNDACASGTSTSHPAGAMTR